MCLKYLIWLYPPLALPPLWNWAVRRCLLQLPCCWGLLCACSLLLPCLPGSSFLWWLLPIILCVILFRPHHRKVQRQVSQDNTALFVPTWYTTNAFKSLKGVSVKDSSPSGQLGSHICDSSPGTLQQGASAKASWEEGGPWRQFFPLRFSTLCFSTRSPHFFPSCPHDWYSAPWRKWNRGQWTSSLVLALVSTIVVSDLRLLCYFHCGL